MDAFEESPLDTESFYKPTEEEIEDVKRMSKEKDVTVLLDVMQKKINGWKEQDLYCGITGSAGSGKSSFINAIRGLKGQDKGAAKVGITETTTEATSYKDPKNEKIQYWDLPGVGTARFPKDDTYLTKVGFERYDFFLIISCTRFTEEDIWLAKQIRNVGKKFYFVRTKLDEDLRSQQREYPDTYNEKEVRTKIYDDSINQLSREGFENPRVFLVSNCYTNVPDFPSLCIELASSLPLYKREALTLSMCSFSKEIIAEKKKILSQHLYFVCTLSAIGAVSPVPGTSVAIDVALILNELNTYKEQFGLDDACIKKYGAKLDEKTLLFITQFASKEVVFGLMKSFATSIAVEEVARYVPVIGSLIAASLSFFTTYAMLSSQLNKLEEVSICMMEQKFENMVDDLNLD